MGKIIGIGFAILVLFGLASGCSNYNNLVGKEELLLKQIGQVQNQMQRQADLLPNLAETVKGYASNEKETFTKLAEARTGLTAVAKMKPEDLANNPALQKQLIEAQTKMNQSLISLNAVRESYPQLQSAPLFQDLMRNVEGSQNRISVARRDVLNVTQEYNEVVRKVPGKIWAAIFGFQVKPQFEASEEGKQTPKLKF